eukprot:TsM_001013900 transcript=TsM_001013900 gene=TsM_001013900
MHFIGVCLFEGEGRLGEWEANNGEEVEPTIIEGDSITWNKKKIKNELKEEDQEEKEIESGKKLKDEWRLLPTKGKVEEKARVEAEALANTEETKKKEDRRNGEKGEEGLVNVEKSMELEAGVEAKSVAMAKMEEKLEAEETKIKAEGKRKSLRWLMRFQARAKKRVRLPRLHAAKLDTSSVMAKIAKLRSCRHALTSTTNFLKEEEHNANAVIDTVTDQCKSASAVDDAPCNVFSPPWTMSGSPPSHLLQRTVHVA